MHVYSYRHFLNSLEKKSPHGSVKKSISRLVLAAIIVVFVTSVLLFYQYSKEKPIRLKKAYLENTVIQFNSTKATTDELVKNFQIAGARVEFFKPQDEGSQTKDAYYIASDDLDRMIAQIKQARQNLQNFEKQRSSKNVPDEFTDLDRQIKSQNSQLFTYLENLLKKYQTAKEITLALGPDLYFPTLTQKGLWEQDREKVSSYYQQKLDIADNALAKLAQIAPPEDFANYHRYEITYLETLVNLARDIKNMLSVDDDLNIDNATQIEKAYALAVKTDTNSQQLIRKILEERARIFDSQTNLNELAKIKIAQNSIGGELEYFVNTYSQISVINFGGLQIPHTF